MDWTNYGVWWGFFIAACVCFVGSIAFAWARFKSKYKSSRFLDPLKILVLGVITSALFLFIPIYEVDLYKTGCSGFEVFFVSLHNVIRLFVVDGDFNFITDVLAKAMTELNVTSLPFYTCYSVFFAVLFVWAPILTFTFVMSFFKNMLSAMRYFFHFRAEVFAFSGLSDKSLALAESLYKNKGRKNRVFVFAGVEENDETRDLIGRAKEIKALCFGKDISDINFTLFKKKRRISFFAIGENQSENVNTALRIIKEFKSRDNTNLYVASTNVETEMMLSSAFDSTDGEANIKVRIVNEVQSLILRNLYENGYEKIFQSAYDDGSGVKKINAVVIGMGQHGTEMTKALSWFCQMDGYIVSINSFDISMRAEDIFTSNCPELMAMSGNDIVGEAKYTINIHSGININTKTFDDILLSLQQTTYAFVALGNDEKNIDAAVKMRMLFERIGCYPVIQAVVYNADKKESLTGATNYRGEPFDIDFIGDLKTTYSEEVILGTDVEAEALARHTRFCSVESFWQYNYNYKSSVASAIHKHMKVLCGVPGIEKRAAERTPEELRVIRVLEHNRWNAYMRSEGYVYSGSTDKSSRNDIAKKHNCLVPFDELSEEEQKKDDD